MAAPKRPTHTVVHPRLFLANGGKTQHVAPGTPLTMDPASAKKLEAAGKIAPIKSAEALDLTAADAEDKGKKQ